MKIWRLKKGADRRLRQGHPWVFASELAHSQKEVRPGELVEMHDAADRFLAYGYAHPSSQICFRKLTARSKETDVFSKDFFERRLRTARDLRAACDWTSFSHRWVYAEADGIPGLMVDAFKLRDGEWLAVVQASTAGCERVLPTLYEALRGFAAEFGSLTVVEAPSSRSRLLEGLSVSEKKIVFGDVPSAALTSLEIELMDGLRVKADFLGGQKTGFFLDQQWNASLLKRALGGVTSSAPAPTPTRSPVKVLDICCYVGQWATHAVAELRRRLPSVEVEATLLDTSSAALAFAESNVTAAGGAAITHEGDALQAVGELPEGEFDVVICDPPAFVKKKADLEAGLRAYAKLNRDAMRRVRPGGVFVSSSCSGLVKSADFAAVLQEASAKAGRSFKQCFLGGHGPDHPLRPEFPEGEYLKCLIGRVDFPY